MITQSFSENGHKSSWKSDKKRSSVTPGQVTVEIVVELPAQAISPSEWESLSLDQSSVDAQRKG